MKKAFTLLAIIAILSSCKKDNEQSQPQSPNTTTTNPTYFTFNGSIGTNDNSTLISADSNLIICGNSGSNVSLLKISKSGTQVWRKDFAAGNMSSASGIVQTSNQELFVCGITYRNYSISNADMLLIKTNSSGDTIWTKTYGGTEYEYAHDIIATSDGNLLFAGRTESFGAGMLGDIYLVKVNTNGDTLWTKSYPDPDQEVAFHLMETQNGEYLVTGSNEDSVTSRELYLLKVSSNGTQLWNKKFGSANTGSGYSTVELTNNDLVTCGLFQGQVLIVKTDNLGSTIWKKEFGNCNLQEVGNSIKTNNDGSFSITGSSYDVSTMKHNIVFLKIDKDGNQLALKDFGGTDDDFGINLIKDTNGDNIITGTSYSYGGIYMTKLASNGDFK